MPITDKFFAINIRKYLALGNDDEAGEPALIRLLSGFSCPKNPDLERFLSTCFSLLVVLQFYIAGYVVLL